MSSRIRSFAHVQAKRGFTDHSGPDRRIRGLTVQQWGVLEEAYRDKHKRSITDIVEVFAEKTVACPSSARISSYLGTRDEGRLAARTLQSAGSLQAWLVSRTYKELKKTGCLSRHTWIAIRWGGLSQTDDESHFRVIWSTLDALETLSKFWRVLGPEDRPKAMQPPRRLNWCMTVHTNTPKKSWRSCQLQLEGLLITLVKTQGLSFA